MGRNYMGQVTDQDIKMVSLLIENPMMTLEDVGAKLGVTKQAVAERKQRLEELGLVKSFFFWNVTPRFECTKWVHIAFENPELTDRVLEVLNSSNLWLYPS